MTESEHHPTEVDESTVKAEQEEAGSGHGADRAPTSDEERLADESRSDVDVAAVAEHHREMDRLGAEVTGEGQIS